MLSVLTNTTSDGRARPRRRALFYSLIGLRHNGEKRPTPCRRPQGIRRLPRAPDDGYGWTSSSPSACAATSKSTTAPVPRLPLPTSTAPLRHLDRRPRKSSRRHLRKFSRPALRLQSYRDPRGTAADRSSHVHRRLQPSAPRMIAESDSRAAQPRLRRTRHHHQLVDIAERSPASARQLTIVTRPKA